MLTELEYNLTLPSMAINISKVEPFIERVREDLNISDDIYGNMLVAITEAVNNAILHGNSENPDKMVEISAKKTGNNQICFTIKDEGSGFDYNNLPDPTSPENLEKPTGRGVFLMTHLSDMVVFADNGSTVEVFFKY